MKKSIALGLMALGLATTMVVGLKMYKDANPQLVGRCFVFSQQGMLVGLQIWGETKTTYKIIASNGFVSIQLEAPKTEVVKSYREKEIKEIDCQTGVSKDE
jgi:hypothetical protein